MDLKDSHFSYNTLLKFEQDIELEALQLFPGCNEVSFQSRIFQNYAECVKSCKGIMSDIAAGINENLGEPKYKVGAEVNPLYSNAPSLSKDWGAAEVARFWVFDKALEGTGANISAVCRGSVTALPKISQVTN